MENISDYLVKNPKQIIVHLKTLAKEKCLISAGFGENHSFLTAILDIDTKKQIITIDCGPKEYLNKELLNSGIVECKTDYKGIKVLFNGHGIKKAGGIGNTALSIKLPNQIYWVQRRLFYRVRSPLSKHSYCSISFKASESKDEQTLDYKLFDLSASGFSIICDSVELAEDIVLGSEFIDAQLTLNETETHKISFIPRNRIAVNPNKPTKSQRIGCEFVNLSPRAENAFIRYMQEIERETKKNFD